VRRETGNEQSVQVRYDEGVAIHIGPEPCVAGRGHFLIKRKTRRDRMQAKLQEIKKELRGRMHQPIPEQGQWLKQIVTGYFHYHAVPTDSRALARFHHHIAHLWLRVLRRRSQRDGITWERRS
jgi:hypothetical protein